MMESWQIGVIGTGLMGRGIAELLANRGHHVRIFDSSTGLATQTAAELTGARTGTVLPFETLDEAVHGCALVIEAVAERLDISWTCSGESKTRTRLR